MKSRMSHVLIYNNYNVSVSKRAHAYKRYDFIIHFASKFVVNTVKLTIFLTDEVADFHCGGRFPRALLQPLPSRSSVQGLKLVLIPPESPPPFQSNQITVDIDILMYIFPHITIYTFYLLRLIETWLCDLKHQEA